MLSFEQGYLLFLVVTGVVVETSRSGSGGDILEKTIIEVTSVLKRRRKRLGSVGDVGNRVCLLDVAQGAEHPVVDTLDEGNIGTRESTEFVGFLSHLGSKLTRGTLVSAKSDVGVGQGLAKKVESAKTTSSNVHEDNGPVLC